MPLKERHYNHSYSFLRKVNNRSPTRFYELKNWSVSKPEWPSILVPQPLSHYKQGLNNDCDWFDPAWPDWDPREKCYMPSFQWDDRLYAGAYAKAWSVARGASAEWGMNILQAKKSVSTFLELAILSLVAIEGLKRSYRRGFAALVKEPSLTPKSVQSRLSKKEKALRRINGREAAERRKRTAERLRIEDEIFVLRQIANLLLAYRYGVAPLMSDLASTAEIISKPYDPPRASVRKSAQRGRGFHSDPGSWRNHKFVGTERCTVQFLALMENPNLALANKLGFTNPLYWLWDSTPWTHIIDWWLPVGTFLNSLTASVGFNYVSSNVTRTMKLELTMVNDYRSQRSLVFKGTGWCTYKERKVLVTLPPPLTIPYGTGLGIARGQNAVATIVQLLTNGK